MVLEWLSPNRRVNDSPVMPRAVWSWNEEANRARPRIDEYQHWLWSVATMLDFDH